MDGLTIGQPELVVLVEGGDRVTEPGDEVGVDDLLGAHRARVSERGDDDDGAAS